METAEPQFKEYAIEEFTVRGEPYYHPVGDRITSYNVCYTKLLRIKAQKQDPDAYKNYVHVITSYSIHYTKLYETENFISIPTDLPMLMEQTGSHFPTE